MKKYFITSDIHGFYTEFRSALKKAGFRVKNPDHILIVCGDIFDRGTEPLKVYKWLRKLPKNRRVLIRGNHEFLLKKLVKRGYAEIHDKHNKTIDTLYQLHGYENERDFINQMYSDQYLNTIKYGSVGYELWRVKWIYANKKIFRGVVDKVLKWIDSDNWVDYYELDKYIFVHSFIPLEEHINFERSRECGYIIKDKPDSYNPNWRHADLTSWETATWGCPWKQFKEGLFNEEIKKGKVLVCGHWHASDFWNNLEGKHLNTYTDNPIFYSKEYPNLIALDACTAATNGINVLVINEDKSIEIYNHNEGGKHNDN